jgi:hypothetical protein
VREEKENLIISGTTPFANWGTPYLLWHSNDFMSPNEESFRGSSPKFGEGEAPREIFGEGRGKGKRSFSV